MPELALVIPVYNEEEIIQTVISDWHQLLEKMHVSFVIAVYNDGSKDNTLKKLQELKFPHLKIIDKKNSGHGPTILQGYKDYAGCEWVFQLDSDHELRTEEFSTLWNNRKNYDFLVGNRIQRDSPLPRRVMTFVSYLTVRLLYGHGILDTNVPYRLMRMEKFRNYLTKLEGVFAPNILVSAIAAYNKLRIFQTPVRFYSRTTGEVSIQKWKLLKVAVRSFQETISFRGRI